MLRLVIAALLLYLIFMLVYSTLTGRRRKGKGQTQAGDRMVLDPHCKSYVPKQEAYAHKGHYFCSKECAQAYLASG